MTAKQSYTKDEYQFFALRTLDRARKTKSKIRDANRTIPRRTRRFPAWRPTVSRAGRRLTVLMIFLLCLSSLSLWAHEPKDSSSVKSVRAIRTPVPPKIDGVLDDEVWKQAKKAKGFYQLRY